MRGTNIIHCIINDRLYYKFPTSKKNGVVTGQTSSLTLNVSLEQWNLKLVYHFNTHTNTSTIFLQRAQSAQPSVLQNAREGSTITLGGWRKKDGPLDLGTEKHKTKVIKISVASLPCFMCDTLFRRTASSSMNTLSHLHTHAHMRL